MLRFYDYVFYRFYCNALRGWWNNSVIASLAAFIQIGMLLWLNIMTTLLVVEVVAGWKIIENMGRLDTWQIGLIWLVLSTPLWLLWGSPRYMRIVEEFNRENETPRKKLMHSIYIKLYIFAWLAVAITCVLIVRHRNFLDLHNGQ